MFGKMIKYSLAEYERIAVFKNTGEFVGIRGPGEVRLRPDLGPFMDGEEVRDIYGRVVIDPESPNSRFDLRETSERLPAEHCITSDSAPVDVIPTIVYKITDPERLVLNVQDFHSALASSASSLLRSTVGEMTLMEVITGGQTIAERMASRFAEEASRWGIAVLSFQVDDIRPDQSVVTSMNARRAAEEDAERERQRTVVAAEARRQGAVADNEAAIARAETEKQTAIAQAEAYKQAAITRAEGDRQAEILKAEGLSALYKALMELGDGAEIALRYEQIQALRNLSESSNSKLVIVPANMAAVNNVAQLPFIEGVIPPVSNDQTGNS